MNSVYDEPNCRVVATRSFRTEENEIVVASICEPVETAPDEWTCVFRIVGLQEEVEVRARSIDSLEALMMAIEGLRVYLERLGPTLTWFDGEPGAHGIPRPIPNSFGLAVERHLSKVIDDEVSLLVEAKKRARGG